MKWHATSLNTLYFYSRSRSRGARNGGVDPSAWRSYEPEPLSSDQDSPAIPKFQPDPEIPLENMVALGDHHGGSDHSESEDGVDEGHGSSPQKWRCVSTVDIGPEGTKIRNKSSISRNFPKFEKYVKFS